MSGGAETGVRSVAIVGLGLIGGSLARSLKALEDPPRVVASSNEPGALDRARTEGVVDGASLDPAEVAGAADLVVYATPLDATLELLGAHRERWRPGAVLTDVVSLKVPLARRVRELGVEDRWVGGHPMAGSERSGYAASRPDLFGGAVVYLVGERAGSRARSVVEDLWSGIGARPEWLDADGHDRRMVWASHLPQLVASALAGALEEAGISHGWLGPGGRDMTRLAGSSPELWRGLYGSAPERRERRALRAIIRELETLEELVGSGDLDRLTRYMERTGRWREEEG